MDEAKERFSRAIEEAVDWAVDGNVSIDDMIAELNSWISNMKRYPEEFSKP